MSEKVEILIYVDRCIYVNDYRIAGSKPYSSENLKVNSFKVNVSDILDQIDIGDIKKYIKEKNK